MTRRIRGPRKGSVVRECVVCGQPYSDTPSTFARGRKYCSAACYRSVVSKRPMLLVVTCDACARTFRRTRAVVERTEKHYCSRACQGVGQKAPPDLRPCGHCGEMFDRWRVSTGARATHRQSAKFCSESCRRASQRAAIEAARRSTCRQCGTSFLRRAHNKGIFCSKACQGESSRRADGHMGYAPSYRGPGWARLAQEIRERDGFACRNCGEQWEEGATSFPVDHIRAWREFDSIKEANHPRNLVTLCPACHAWKTGTLERRALAGDRVALNAWRRVILRKTPGHPNVVLPGYAFVLGYRAQARYLRSKHP